MPKVFLSYLYFKVTKMVGKAELFLVVGTLVLILVFLFFQFGDFFGQENNNNEVTTTIKMNSNSGTIRLPEPRKEGEVSVEEAIAGRRSRRSYQDEELTLEEVSQLLWAAQGITKGVNRAAPSAGGTYPLELFLVVGKVEGMNPGVYRYLPGENSLVREKEGDIRNDLAVAALGQNFIAEAPVDIVFTAIYERTTQVYGERGIMYVHMEAGHAAENVYLECESLGLGTVVVGAFHDDQVKKVLDLEKGVPLYIMPVGKV